MLSITQKRYQAQRFHFLFRFVVCSVPASIWDLTYVLGQNTIECIRNSYSPTDPLYSSHVYSVQTMHFSPNFSPSSLQLSPTDSYVSPSYYSSPPSSSSSSSNSSSSFGGNVGILFGVATMLSILLAVIIVAVIVIIERRRSARRPQEIAYELMPVDAQT